MTPSFAQAQQAIRRQLASEKGTIYKDWGGRIPIALIFPNRYRVAMSNLGYQTLYGLFNAEQDIVCERVTWEGPDPVPISMESQRYLGEFPIWAISIPFELDYFHLISLIHQTGIPLWAAERENGDPFLIGGGASLSANPEPMAPFFDAIVIGEAEPMLGGLLASLRAARGLPRDEILVSLAEIPGVYVPSLHSGQTIVRQWARDLSSFATTSVILTRQTEFGDVFLIEIARGCCWRCRFCLTGHMFRPMRFRRLKQLEPQIAQGLRFRQRIGLVGAAVSDHPDLEAVTNTIQHMGGGFTVASLRADQLTPTLLKGLRASGTRTLTLAPEVGSDRMAEVIGKGFGEKELLRAVDMAREADLQRLKLYFMLGLPEETDEDVSAIVALAKKIHNRMGRGSLRLSVAPFVPKAHTPFQRAAMADASLLQKRLQFVKRELQAAQVTVEGESVAWARIQGVLSRGDQRLAAVIAQQTGRSLGHWRRAMKKARLSEKEYLQAYSADQVLPWTFIEPRARDPRREKEQG
jgi:radical SAM superfamily enzyme YgiQ (UPF0313 family)